MPDGSSALDRVLDLHRRGDFARCRAAAEAALPLKPVDALLLRLLGDSCCRTGDLPEGIAYLRQALKVAPGDAAVRADLANALVAVGDLSGAAALCGDAAEPSPELGRLRGYILQAQGRHSEAIGVYRRLLEEAPEDWEAWNNLGNALRAVGDRAGAAEALAEAARLRPDMAAVHFNLGAVLVEAGRLGEGVPAYRAAARLAPDNAPAQFELGRLLRYVGQAAEALAPLERAAELAPGQIEVRLEQARALVALTRFDEAESAYRQALEVNPRSAAAYFEFGILLERGNRLSQLADLLESAEAEAVPADRLAYLRALALSREGRVEEALALARTAPPHLEPGRRARLIGRLADKLDDPDTAFPAFEEMNRIKLRQHPDARERAARYRQAVEALTALVTPDWFGSWLPAEPDLDRAAPIFLVGFPRSGTTLLDTILMGHPDIHVLEEEPILEPVKAALGDFARLPNLDKSGVERLRALYFRELDARLPSTGARIVDKLPLNIMGVPLIHRIFPDASFIFARRHPCDIVLSCFMQDFDINDAMANFLDLDDAVALFDRVLTLWHTCNEVLPLRVHDVRYEAIVEDSEAEVRPLLDFLGLPWDERTLDHQQTAVQRGRIMAPSYDQVTERIYDRASGRWQRYREQMKRVLPVLEPWAERLGYRV